MKKEKFLFIGSIVCFLVVIFFNCSKQDEPCRRSSKDGSLQLTIDVTHSDDMVINTLKSVPIDQYRVIIMTSEHEVFAEFEHFEDVPAEITLAVGNYYVIAHSDNDSSAAFENPYFYGQTEIFTIGTGEAKQINVECEIANCAITIDYTDEVINSFSDFFTVVKNAEDSLIFTSIETRTGYFNIQPLSVYAILTFNLSNGNSAQKRIGSEIDVPQAGNLYAITVDASVSNMKTGIHITLAEDLDTNYLGVNDYINSNDLQQGELLITEIMYDPSALSDTEGEWFEVYNNTSSPVNLQDLVLRNGSDDHVVNEKILIYPGAYFTFARSDTAFEGEKYVYTSINFTNTTDDISLYTYGSDGTDGTLIATVTYDESNGFPNGSGESINLCITHFNFSEAQLSTSWCLSADTFNTGDYGTPGLTNINCE